MLKRRLVRPPAQVAAVAAGGEQRTTEWHRLRERRLTASAFSKALGFFTGGLAGGGSAGLPNLCL